MRLIRLLKNEIAKEALVWVDKDIITPIQAEQICDQYGVDFHGTGNRAAGYHILLGLGYLFVGLALITLIGANWEQIPRFLRMAGLIGLTLVTQGWAVKNWLLGREDRAAGIFLLGNLFYGASIILIAQIYHLGEHMPDGVFWWALGCLPIGVLINSPWVTLQALVLSGIWFFLEVDLGFYPTLFPVFILGGITVLYRGKQSLLLFSTVTAAIGFWVEYTLSALWSQNWYYHFYAEHLFVGMALFLSAYAFSHWLNQKSSVKAKDYGALLAVWSLRFGLIFMMVMSFKEPWKELLDTRFNHVSSMGFFVTGLLIASFLTARQAGKIKSVLAITGMYAFFVLAVLLVNDEAWAVYFQIAANIALVAAGIWLIISGINQGISHYFFLGIASILITALLRYADLIGDYIGGAVLFMFFAILLLGAAKFWKKYQSREGEI